MSDQPSDAASKSQPPQDTKSDPGTNAPQINFNAPATINQFAARDIINSAGVTVSITQSDQQLMRDLFQQVWSTLKAQPLPTAQKEEAEQNLKKLENELTEAKKPSGEVIKQTGSRLLDLVPAIGKVLGTLFGSPVVGKIVEGAGSVAVEWVKARFSPQQS
jgi:hypothetical protein